MTELLIQENQEKKQIALVENGKLIEYYEEDNETNRREGNIYIGIVKDIIKGMQAAFVDIGTEKNSFIHLKDILPKIDETKETQDENIKISDIIKPNQKLLVQIKKDSNEKKGARVSTHINLPSKYIVLMPNTEIITVSQKIESEEEQKRLVKLVKENLEQGNGAIIRTSAQGKEKEIIEDIKNIQNKWNKIIEKLKELPFTSKDARTFMRMFLSGATECELDKNGRVNIVNTLSSYAGITKECVILGVNDRLEIWSEDKFNNFFNNNIENFSDIAENLFSAC